MNMKRLIDATKITSVILSSCLLFSGAMYGTEPKTSTVFLQTDKINEESDYDCIEAYQTENSTAIEAYLHQVHCVEQN